MDDDLGGATMIDSASGFEDTVNSLVGIDPLGDITDAGLAAPQGADDEAPTHTRIRARRVTAAYGDWPLTPPDRR